MNVASLASFCPKDILVQTKVTNTESKGDVDEFWII